MPEEPSGREAALVYLCSRKVTLQLLFYGGILGLVLNTASLAVVGLNSAAGPVVVLNYVGLLFFVVLSGGILWRCTQFDA